MRRKGLFTRLWEWLFGDALPPSECFTQYCTGNHDPRCGGGNCTKHCNEHCRGLCSSRSVVPGNLTSLNGMGHDAHCMTVGLQHVYMCRACGFRMLVPTDMGVLSGKSASAFLDDIQTCDTFKVREVMES